MKAVAIVLSTLLLPSTLWAAGFGIFTQGASGLGQANAVVAHSTGPSSLYFNPALLADLEGLQVEIGTTAVSARRKVHLDSGGTEKGRDHFNFPSTFYLTQKLDNNITGGIGIFSPFGLSNAWDDDYEGRYIGTSGDMLSVAINPVLSFRLTDYFSLAAGFDLIYLDTELQRMINQTIAGTLLPPEFGGPVLANLPDARQKFRGDGWGAGYNLGILFRPGNRISVGAAYRSQTSIDISGSLDHYSVDPKVAILLPSGSARSNVKLPAQFVSGIAFKCNDQLTIEAGVRWEDWASTDQLSLESEKPVLGQNPLTIPRNWHSTWAYNLGGSFTVNEIVTVNAGYLYGENPVPASTFEPIIPDSDAHLFTAGIDLSYSPLKVSVGAGYEHHEDRNKENGATINDTLGSLAAGQPVGTADGTYETDIFLAALSIGYTF